MTRSARGRGAILVAAVAALGTASPAWAVQVSCGQTISQTTKVSNNLDDCPGNGLVIDTSNVTLDLNGRTLDGNGSGNGDGIVIEGNLEGVIVKNGKIRQFEDGIEILQDGTRHRLLNLKLTENVGNTGLEIGDGVGNSLVRSVSALDNNGLGFLANGDHSGLVFQRTTAIGNGNRGYNLEGFDNGLFEKSSARDNGNDGLRLGDGSSGSLIRDFVGQRNDGVGVNMSGSGNTALRVRALANEAVGIVVFGDDHKVLYSVANDNGGDGPFDDGILLFGSILPATDILLVGNSANRNEDGITIQSGASGTLRRNTANDNDDVGIDNQGTVTDLGRNRAKGNGGQNCVNVTC